MSLDASHFKLYLVKDFLEVELCREITTNLAAAPAKPATVYGSAEDASVVETIRRTSRVTPPQPILQTVEERLAAKKQEIGLHYGIGLHAHEEPQFLRYRIGDFFVAHQDGNTGLIRSEKEDRRKISVVIFLNSHSENAEEGGYGGGALVFTEWRQPPRGQFHFYGEQGSLVAFPSETTHEVLPITHGERYSIASWYG